jgi:acyl CoA:acetate/3-ketoacid CoA transferase
VAKGIDVRRDILDQMAFAPARIADPLPAMDASLFAESPETGKSSDTMTQRILGSV